MPSDTTFDSSIIAADRSMVVQTALDIEFRRAQPFSCARLCLQLSQTRQAGEPNWHKEAAFLFISVGDTRSLTFAIRTYVDTNRFQAILDAQDLQLQQQSPIYCATIYSLLAQTKKPTEQSWDSAAARLYALSGNEKALIFHAARFVRNERSRAIHDAQDPRYQHKNPTYSASLYYLLNKYPLPHEPCWAREAARLYAQLGREKYLMTQTRKYIRSNRLGAFTDMQDSLFRAKNPVFCDAILNCLLEEHLNYLHDWIVRQLGQLLPSKAETGSHEVALLISKIVTNQKGDEQSLMTLTDYIRSNWPSGQSEIMDYYLLCQLTNAVSFMVSREDNKKAQSFLIFLQCFIRTVKAHEADLFSRPFSNEVNQFTPFNLLIESLYWDWDKMSQDVRASLIQTLKIMLRHSNEALFTEGVFYKNQLIDTPLRLLASLLEKHPNDLELRELIERAVQKTPEVILNAKALSGDKETVGEKLQLYGVFQTARAPKQSDLELGLTDGCSPY